MRRLEDYLHREARELAPYAVRAAESRGRRHAEAEHPLRSPFERDRDRIIHSSAFRRLEYKTQVFVNHEGDYYRTRLTHTLEVAQITRTLARFLELNEDLAEAIALVHDVGHPPFGHAGEHALQEAMREHGGFEHNLQGLRVVEKLESRYPRFPGLNLTWEVREGIAKHSKRFDTASPLPELAEFAESPFPSLEAQLADAADQIAYNAHDVDDGVTAGLVRLEQLQAVPLWRRVTADQDLGALTPEQAKYLGVRALINAQVIDLAATVERRISEWRLDSPDAVRSAPDCAATLSAEMRELNQELREFLRQNVYRNYRVSRMSIKARRLLTALFESYLEYPEQLPPEARRSDDLRRDICDYLAGLTDREAMNEYRRLFDPFATH